MTDINQTNNPNSFASITGIPEPTVSLTPQSTPVYSPTINIFSSPQQSQPMVEIAAPDPVLTFSPQPEEKLLPEPVSPPPIPGERLSYEGAQIQEIELAKVVPNPYQPRKVFDTAALKELADSIKEHGVIQPLVVTKTPIGYELVVGERRFRASQLAGLLKVPAIIKESMVDQTKLEVALIENIQRKELNPIEEAQAYDRLMKTFNLTQDQVAKKVGKSRPAVANTVRLLNLPAEVQRAVSEGKISEGHGRALLGLGDTERILLMYKAILEQNLNVRQVEVKVRELSLKRQMDAAAPDPKLMALESELRGRLGTQVKIQRQGGGGKITIEFFSEEELSELVHKISSEQASETGGYLVV